MRIIGSIIRLQVQQISLKVGESADRRYDPRGLVSVPQLVLTPQGALGLTATGDLILDVHHADHPQTSYRGENPLSLGFTSHYEVLRNAFGPHLTDGIAGENMLVDVPTPLALSDLGPRLAIATADGRVVPLQDVIVAAPCAPFARFALRDANPAPTVLKEALIRLNNGTRGYYGQLAAGSADVTVACGDQLVLLGG